MAAFFLFLTLLVGIVAASSFKTSKWQRQSLSSKHCLDQPVGECGSCMSNKPKEKIVRHVTTPETLLYFTKRNEDFTLDADKKDRLPNGLIEPPKDEYTYVIEGELIHDASFIETWRGVYGREGSWEKVNIYVVPDGTPVPETLLLTQYKRDVGKNGFGYNIVPAVACTPEQFEKDFCDFVIKNRTVLKFAK